MYTYGAVDGITSGIKGSRRDGRRRRSILGPTARSATLQEQLPHTVAGKKNQFQTFFLLVSAIAAEFAHQRPGVYFSTLPTVHANCAICVQNLDFRLHSVPATYQHFGENACHSPLSIWAPQKELVHYCIQDTITEFQAVHQREQMGYGKTGIKTGIKTGGIGGRSADFEFYVVPCSVAPFLLERGALASPLHRAALPFPVQLCPSWDTHQHAPVNKDVGISRQFKLPE
ncbi:hypothetical protein DFH09DRAFT_1290107 [Mycena vulgaris]|nr:hypothetical protein DFH09DRAFT_1290107 [Mycena vulgaris]